MNRRKFLSTLIGGVATAAAVRTFPFRVYSFPKEIITPVDRFIDVPFIAMDSGYRHVIAIAIYRAAIGGPYVLERLMSLEEARDKFGSAIWIPTQPSEPRGPSRFDVLI